MSVVLSPKIEYSAPPGCSDDHIKLLQQKAAFFSVIGYQPHQKQWDLMHCRNERYVAECWPRQHGKSTGMAYEMLWSCASKPRCLVWLVAPTYDLCTPIFDELERAVADKCKFDEFKPTQISRRDLYITWNNGSRLQCKSAENVLGLQGRRLDRLFIEEAASISDPLVWQQYLRPMLAVTQAPMMAISTPKGFNWFFDLAQKGMDPLEPDYFFGRAPLGCSPYIKPEEIEEARKTLPQRVFQQEWEAEFVSDAGAVFRGVKDCVLPGVENNEPPQEGHFYAAGVDLAKYQDYSVITIIDRIRKRQVYFERFNEVDWHRQIPIFAAIVNKYGGHQCPVLVDSTGVGDPIYEYMRKSGMRVYGYNLQSGSKEDIINHLALLIEKRELSLMDIQEQTNELVGYEYHRTKTGRLSMSAPGKQNDDCVIALALAAWQAFQGTGVVKTMRQGWRL